VAIESAVAFQDLASICLNSTFLHFSALGDLHALRNEFEVCTLGVRQLDSLSSYLLFQDSELPFSKLQRDFEFVGKGAVFPPAARLRPACPSSLTLKGRSGKNYKLESLCSLPVAAASLEFPSGLQWDSQFFESRVKFLGHMNILQRDLGCSPIEPVHVWANAKQQFGTMALLWRRVTPFVIPVDRWTLWEDRNPTNFAVLRKTLITLLKLLGDGFGFDMFGNLLSHRSPNYSVTASDGSHLHPKAHGGTTQPGNSFCSMTLLISSSNRFGQGDSLFPTLERSDMMTGLSFDQFLSVIDEIVLISEGGKELKLLNNLLQRFVASLRTTCLKDLKDKRSLHAQMKGKTGREILCYFLVTVVVEQNKIVFNM
jgi:hypothetical protein